MPEPTIHLKNRYLAALLAWLVPGLGHFYQGRTGKGILYAVCILSLFFVGLAQGDWRIIYWRWINPLQNSEQFCFNYLGQFWAGLPALPALIQATLKWYGFDPILWGFMAEPTQNEINGLYRHGKFLEIGTLYTTVAGLLNVLAIYDAYEGPAQVDEPEPAPRLRPPASSRSSSMWSPGRDLLRIHPAARRGDQPGLLRLPPRILAPDLVAIAPTLRRDLRDPPGDDDRPPADQHPGLSRRHSPGPSPRDHAGKPPGFPLGRTR